MKKTLTKEELVKLIMEEVKSNFNSKKPIIESKETIKDEPESSFKAEEIEKLAEEIKKINKSLSFNNPVICQEDNSLIDRIIKENKIEEKREPNLENINKNKEVYHKGETEGDKWKRMLNYSIPKDTDR